MDSDGGEATDGSSKQSIVITALREQHQYIDEQIHSVCVARVDLVPGGSSLAIVLLNGAG